MRTAKEIADDFDKLRQKQNGLGSLEQSLQMQVYILEVLLDIRELLQGIDSRIDDLQGR